MDEPSKRLRLLVHAYAIGAAVVLLVVALIAANSLAAAKADSVKRHKKRFASSEPPAPAEGKHPVDVRTGLYIDRVTSLDFPGAAWSVDFYIWFDWTGDNVSPGKRFQVIDGQIDSSVQIREFVEGAHHNELYKVTATMTKVFDVSRFPADDHLMTISIEDTLHGMDDLRYVADEAGSETSSRVKVPGYVIKRSALTVKPHDYKSTRGDPHLAADHISTHSQLMYGIWIGRADWGLFLKLFLTLYLAVAVSMLVFFIKPTDVDARFGLSVGALFAVIANAYVVSASLPEGSGLSMGDFITGMATLTLLLTLVQSTIALTLCHRGHEALADRFDRITFVSLTGAFIVANIIVPLSAT